MAAGRTGILTFHRCVNYGSYWQARCLAEGLRSFGLDPVILNHDAWRIRRAEWGCALRPVLPSAVTWRDRLLYGWKSLRFQRALDGLPLSPRFSLDAPPRMDAYALIVVGSDEVWNLCHPWYGGCPLFFGVGLSGRLIAYAASFGNYDAAWGLSLEWSERLRAFESISVRDDNSARLIRASLGFEPQRVLDPCLQFPARPQSSWCGLRQPFVAVYGHGFSAMFSRQVRRAAKALGLSLLSIGYRNDWADRQWLTASPEDFAQAMSRARAVATNFFHGCVFALLNGKPLICETMPYREHKVRDLLQLMSAEDRLVGGQTPADVYARLLETPSGGAIGDRLAHERRRTADWLAEALAGDGERLS